MLILGEPNAPQDRTLQSGWDHSSLNSPYDIKHVQDSRIKLTGEEYTFSALNVVLSVAEKQILSWQLTQPDTPQRIPKM